MVEMTEEAKELRRQYFREYRAKNRERIREQENKLWNKKAEELRAKQQKDDK